MPVGIDFVTGESPAPIVPEQFISGAIVADPIFPRIQFHAQGTILKATSNPTFVAPTQSTADFNLLFVVVKPYNGSITPPAGWELLIDTTSGSVASGSDTGSVRLLVYYNMTGVTGNAVCTSSGTDTIHGVMVSYTKQYPDDVILMALTQGCDTTSGADYSATMADNLKANFSDFMIFFTGSNASFTPTSPTISTPGTTGNSTQRIADANSTGNHSTIALWDRNVLTGIQSSPSTYTYTTATANVGCTAVIRFACVPAESCLGNDPQQVNQYVDDLEAFPDVIVEWAPAGDFSERTYAPTGFTDITGFVASISGTLRSREYEAARPEAGSISIALDNNDGRFTPGSVRSPYWPNVKANRRLRVRGKNMVPMNIALGGGKEHSTLGFRNAVSSPYTSVSQGTVALGTHDPWIVPAGIGKYHIEATLKDQALSGVHDILEWYVPVELGQRLTHSAYVWKVKGLEPAGTQTRMAITYYDADDQPILPTNIALNKTASSPQASCNGNETVDKAVNGTYNLGLSDKFCSSAGGPYTLKVDLGSKQAISGFAIYHAGAGGETDDFNTKNYTIQVSDNDSTYTTVVTVTNNIDSINRHLVWTSARYVKIVATNAGSDGIFRIYEFQTFGTDGVVDAKSSYANWIGTDTAPMRVGLSDQAPANARYGIMSLRILNPTKMTTGDLTYAITGIQTEVPENFAPLTDATNFGINNYFNNPRGDGLAILNNDPTFEVNPDTYLEWQTFVATTSVIRSNIHALYGAWSLKWTPSGAANPQLWGPTHTGVVIPGAAYHLDAKYWCGQSMTLQGGMYWLDANGALISQTLLSVSNASNVGNWQQISHTVTAPDGAYSVAITFFSTTGSSSFPIWFDEVFLSTPVVNERIITDTDGTVTAAVDATFMQGDANLHMYIPRLTPGETYTIIANVKKTGLPTMIMSAGLVDITDDDVPSSLTGTSINVEGVYGNYYLTFVATRVNQLITFDSEDPQVQITQNGILSIRNVAVFQGVVDPLTFQGIPPTVGWAAKSLEDNGVTFWEKPKPIFEGWTTDIPAQAEDFTSTVVLNVDDRAARLGKIELSHNLREMLFRDGVDLLMPFSEDGIDSAGKVSMLGNWASKSGVTSASLTAMQRAMGNASYTQGIAGPTTDDAIQFSRKTSPSEDGTGYAVPIPYSKDYVPAPVIVNPVKKYDRVWYATWSHSYDKNNVRRWDDAHNPYVYQGDCCSGDSSCCGNGDLKGLIGFNYLDIMNSLAGSSITDFWFHIKAAHWWWRWGGYPIIGWHNYGEAQGPYTYTEARGYNGAFWPNVYSPRNAWLSFSIPQIGEAFKAGRAYGMSTGPAHSRDLRWYGYHYGARTSYPPYLTATYYK